VEKRALIIGIDEYDNAPDLAGCVADARSMSGVLSKNEDGSPNYDCKTVIYPNSRHVDAPTIAKLREEIRTLFDFDGDVLLYFSGHGSCDDTGGHLVAIDGTVHVPGLAMQDIMTFAQNSKARSILLILDCCFSGALGNPPNLQSPVQLARAQLREGVTILAASKPKQSAAEVAGHGVFTHLVLGALNGGAADVRGNVSAASIYAYVEAALGPWDQRPVYKTHASALPPVRLCRHSVSDDLLRELPNIFRGPDATVNLDPSFEHTSETSDSAKVELFEKFKKLRDARLLCSPEGKDLYYAAMDSGQVCLTALGQFYWRLADSGRI